MKRGTLNYIVDLVSLVVMFGMIATGLVIRFVLPPGTGGRHGGEVGRVVWGLGRHDWGDLHFWLAVALGLLILIHVALHWTWVCATTRQLLRRSYAASTETTGAAHSVYGVAFLILVIAAFAGFLWIASASVTTPDTAGRDGGAGRQRTRGSGVADGLGHEDLPADEPETDHDSGPRGTGWGARTLADIESQTGIPVAVLRDKLGLPATVPADERLGRLRQQYGFPMSAIHDIIAEYQTDPASETGKRLE